MPYRDEEDEDLHPWEYPDPEEEVDEEEEEAGVGTVPCPYCHRQVYDQAERCPYCESYISQEDVPAESKRNPWWIIFGALGVMAVVALWILAGPRGE